MEDGRSVEPDVAALREAGDGAAAIDHGRDIAFRDATMAVGAGGDEQRRIVGVDRIEMEAQRDHAVEQGLRRGDMLEAGFDRPGAKAGCFDALTHGDGAVLMPAERPVGGFVFVEQDRTHRLCGVAQMGGGVGADGAGWREKWREFGEGCQALTGAACWQRREGGFDGGEGGGVEGGGDVLRAVGGEGQGHGVLCCVGVRDASGASPSSNCA